MAVVAASASASAATAAGDGRLQGRVPAVVPAAVPAVALVELEDGRLEQQRYWRRRRQEKILEPVDVEAEAAVVVAAVKNCVDQDRRCGVDGSIKHSPKLILMQN